MSNSEKALQSQSTTNKEKTEPGASRDQVYKDDPNPQLSNLAGKGERVISGRESPEWLLRSQDKMKKP